MHGLTAPHMNILRLNDPRGWAVCVQNYWIQQQQTYDSNLKLTVILAVSNSDFSELVETKYMTGCMAKLLLGD